jgi:hypothetical protein
MPIDESTRETQKGEMVVGIKPLKMAFNGAYSMMSSWNMAVIANTTRISAIGAISFYNEWRSDQDSMWAFAIAIHRAILDLTHYS